MNYVFTNRSDLYIIMEYEIERFLHAPLAQLDRVAHYECEGWGFESLMAHQYTLGISTISRVFLLTFSRIKIKIYLFFISFFCGAADGSCSFLRRTGQSISRFLYFCWRSFMHTMYYTSKTYILLDKMKKCPKKCTFRAFHI